MLKSYVKYYATKWWVRLLMSVALAIIMKSVPDSWTAVRMMLAVAFGLSLLLLLLLPAVIRTQPELEPIQKR